MNFAGKTSIKRNVYIVKFGNHNNESANLMPLICWHLLTNYMNILNRYLDRYLAVNYIDYYKSAACDVNYIDYLAIGLI